MALSQGTKLRTHPVSNSNADVRTRLATAADAAAIIPLVNAAFAVESFLTGTRTDQQRMAKMMQAGEFLIAEDGEGQLLAAVYVELRGARGYFGMLAVDPARQGSGLGRRMIEAAENRCRRLGCNFMDITVLSLRAELLPFYQKFGYLETGREEFTSSRPLQGAAQCHCIVLSKKL
jgi:GNAT superfamily N-acetyltransferase